MARVLIWLLLGGLVWWMWRSRSRPQPATRNPAPPPKPLAVPMLRCHHCGVHLPSSDAVTDAAGHAYCSPTHRDLGPAAPP